jgi:hypothetical protein
MNLLIKNMEETNKILSMKINNSSEDELQKIGDIFRLLMENFEFVKNSNEENFIMSVKNRGNRTHFDLLYSTSETYCFTLVSIIKTFLVEKKSLKFKEFSIKFHPTNSRCVMNKLDKNKIVEFVKNKNNKTNIRYVDFNNKNF